MQFCIHRLTLINENQIESKLFMYLGDQFDFWQKC